MILLYVWLYNENHMYESGNLLTFFLSHFWGLKTCKDTFFPSFCFLVFSLHFLAIYVQYAKAGDISADSN